MRKSLTALTAATTIAVATVATPTTADAQWRRGGWWGPAPGGFALGAIVGSASAWRRSAQAFVAPRAAEAFVAPPLAQAFAPPRSDHAFAPPRSDPAFGAGALAFRS